VKLGQGQEFQDAAGNSGIEVRAKWLDKGKAKDTSTPPPALMSSFGYFDTGRVDEDDKILEEPNAEVEDIQENATIAKESEGEYDDKDDGDVNHDLDKDAEAGVQSDSLYSEPPANDSDSSKITPPADGGGQPE
jgi:hypothetical protein